MGYTFIRCAEMNARIERMKCAFKDQQDNFSQEKNELQCTIQELRDEITNYEEQINELNDLCKVQETKMHESDCLVSTKV